MESFRQNMMQTSAVLIAAVFFVLIFLLNWLGYRVRKRIHQKSPDKDISLGAAEGSVMGLMALALAFSFNMAYSKFETRRQVIIDEANILNTAILRCDLYPDSVKKYLLPDLGNYINSRIEYYNAGDSPGRIKAALDDAQKNFYSIWNKTVLLTRDQANKPYAEQMLPVLISERNMVITRESGRTATIPTLIIIVLLILVFIAAFLTGFGTKPGNRNTIFSIAFALMTSIVLYLIMELGRPRQGYINLQNAEQKIIDLKKLIATVHKQDQKNIAMYN